MSSAEVVRLSASDARTLTDRIKVGVEAVWDLITRAYTERAWDALGYDSWDDYCTREFGTSRLRLPREERTEVVSSLRESGLSIPAIAAATGLGYGTVQREVASGYPNGQRETVDEDALTEKLLAEVGEDDHEPAPVIGLDGKRYQPARPQPKPSEQQPEPRRRALVDSARELSMDLKNLTARAERILADDRFARNKDQVGAQIRHHLGRAIEVFQSLDHQINGE